MKAREWDVCWPTPGTEGGVKGGSLTLYAGLDYRLVQTDYSRQLPFLSGASVATRRREVNRGRTRLYRAAKKAQEG